MTDARLNFLREEILEALAASFAAANRASSREIALAAAGSRLGAACLSCAIVAALGESGALDPSRVVGWANWIGDNLPAATEPAVREAAAQTLKIFASALAALPPAKALDAMNALRTDGRKSN